MNRVHAGLGAVAAVAAYAGSALAVSPYFQDNFTAAGDLAGWGGGATYANPGTGGVDGANDGYLRVSRANPGNFGVRSGTAAYAGDYIAAGITSISLWLNDVDAAQDFNVYVSIGSATNFWQYNFGFTPQNNVWSEFVVDLTDASKWNPTGFASTTLEDALSSTAMLLIRHDTYPGSPAGTGPVPMSGELGIDKITLIPAPGTAPIMLGGLLALARRRR